MSEKFELNNFVDPPLPTTDDPPVIEDDDDVGNYQTKPVSKEPLGLPMTDDASVLNGYQNPNPTATDEEFSGLSFHSSSSSCVVTPHFFSTFMGIETASKPPPRSAPSSCSTPHSIQPIQGKGCKSSDPSCPHFLSPPHSPLKEPKELPTPTDDGPPGDVDETNLVIGGLLCGNSLFGMRNSRQVPNGTFSSSDYLASLLC
jgi:hypothetical protein